MLVMLTRSRRGGDRGKNDESMPLRRQRRVGSHARGAALACVWSRLPIATGEKTTVSKETVRWGETVVRARGSSLVTASISQGNRKYWHHPRLSAGKRY